ncbi:hypothetical protein [Bradyrhizobium sacchari]|nr:hypothetical protein [Bradyrhizobium sacchari]
MTAAHHQHRRNTIGFTFAACSFLVEADAIPVHPAAQAFDVVIQLLLM